MTRRNEHPGIPFIASSGRFLSPSAPVDGKALTNGKALLNGGFYRRTRRETA
jgi:hypothetical protein